MNDFGYYERRSKLVFRLRSIGPAECWALASGLGWSIAETRGKLISLRGDGHVTYDGTTRLWAVPVLDERNADA